MVQKEQQVANSIDEAIRLAKTALALLQVRELAEIDILLSSLSSDEYEIFKANSTKNINPKQKLLVERFLNLRRRSVLNS